jgi:hypothetical protein
MAQNEHATRGALRPGQLSDVVSVKVAAAKP